MDVNREIVNEIDIQPHDDRNDEKKYELYELFDDWNGGGQMFGWTLGYTSAIIP